MFTATMQDNGENLACPRTEEISHNSTWYTWQQNCTLVSTERDVYLAQARWHCSYVIKQAIEGPEMITEETEMEPAATFFEFISAFLLLLCYLAIFIMVTYELERCVRRCRKRRRSARFMRAEHERARELGDHALAVIRLGQPEVTRPYFHAGRFDSADDLPPDYTTATEGGTAV